MLAWNQWTVRCKSNSNAEPWQGRQLQSRTNQFSALGSHLAAFKKTLGFEVSVCTKQLAQEALRPLAIGLRIDNQLRVVSRK